MHLVLNFLLMLFMSLASSDTNFSSNVSTGTTMTLIAFRAKDDEEEDVQEEQETVVVFVPGKLD